MSSITLSPNAAGTATFTLASPGTNTNRTLTLPDETGELATIADVNAAAAAVESMVLLGTIATTSGASQSLAVSLTGYKLVLFDFDGVTTSGASTRTVGGQVVSGTSNAGAMYGMVTVPLAHGRLFGGVNTVGAAASAIIRATGYSTATTSVAVGTDGTFNGGSVRVYGVK